MSFSFSFVFDWKTVLAGGAAAGIILLCTKVDEKTSGEVLAHAADAYGKA